MINNESSFLFYDLETTGLNPCFDQPIQFAAIRTDMDLTEIERVEIRIRLRRDVIVSPMALLTHQQSIDTLLNGISEYEAAKKIHAIMTKPNTLSIGYNSLQFDDEMLRFLFFRQLLPPYDHQFKNGCYRADLLPIVALYWLVKPEALIWPKADNLKLEALSECNQLADGPAHDAIVDVEACVELAKKLRQHRELWDYAINYFQKKIDIIRQSKLPFSINTPEHQFQEALLLDTKYGRAINYLIPAMQLGGHEIYTNQTVWLRLDQHDFSQNTHPNLDEIIPIKKKMGERPLILPIDKKILVEKISPERWEIYHKNKHYFASNAKKLFYLREKLLQETYLMVDNIDAYAALYQMGFASSDEKAILQAFHRQSLDNKMAWIDRFSDPIYQELAKRLIVNALNESSEHSALTEFKSLYTDQDHTRLDYKNQRQLTAHAALDEIASHPNPPKILIDYQAYLLNQIKHIKTAN
jgi:exodeoxyribonuclease-1